MTDADRAMAADGPPTRDLGTRAVVTTIHSDGARKEKLRQRAWKPPASRRSPRPYAELHAASAFSFLDGATLPEDLVDRAAALGLPAVALLDTNGVYGAPRFHKAAKLAGIKALVGAEVVLEELSLPAAGHPDAAAKAGPAGPPPARRNSELRGSQGSLTPALSRRESGGARLALLVENRTGYRNLCRLLTAAAEGREKGAAAASWDLVAAHAGGLRCLTGGAEGPVARALARGGIEAAERALDRLASIFPGRVHVELQRHGDRAEEHRNQALVSLAASRRLPLLATNGVRYAEAREKDLLDVLACIREGKPVDSAGTLLAASRERHFKEAAAMSELFADLPHAVSASAELAVSLDFTLADLGYRFPRYPVPAGETPSSHLRRITWEGARARFRPLTARAQAQLARELAMIEKLDLAGYFLIVWDIVQFCRRERILVQGRGSAANSAVCYALSITAVDPVKMELLFERFLSEERGEWPDIDLDLPSGDEREKVIQHVYRTYGAHGAAMTANVITYRDRSAAREVSKALGFSAEEQARLAAQLSGWSFGEMHEPARELPGELAAAGLDPAETRSRHFLRLWRAIQNLPRHLGQHSGGMVVADGRLDEVVPLEPASMPGRVVVQWDKDDCADLGLIKVELLGLGMMASLQDTLSLLKGTGVAVDLAHLPADDPTVYAMLQKA
ncbi:MAG TPA: PHP domain-containing protein, partial [Thermoanaerobaculia bacterium]|nr:PHP domain-containing protein [Thermoanaerobaculia bacterium]